MKSNRTSMSADDFIAHLDVVYSKCLSTAKKKNEDYSSSDENAFRNFEAVEYFKIADTKTGIMVRLTDKFTRLANLIKGKENKVEDESLQDTIEDFINYLAILHVRLTYEKITEE